MPGFHHGFCGLILLALMGLPRSLPGQTVFMDESAELTHLRGGKQAPSDTPAPSEARISAAAAKAEEIGTSFGKKVSTGIEVLRNMDFAALKGKRVGLVTNPSGVDASLRSTVDVLNAHVNLLALFGPEHGVRGNFSAGDHVADAIDPATGVPVYSLYGANRKPSQESLEGLDVLVYDIQDLGVRSYTYISTLGLVMEAAAEAGIEVMVLDRPNPLGGVRVEGPLVEEGYFSFVSAFAIPYIYGLTPGELARMLNEEGMLNNGLKCKLTVVPMEGWRRDMVFGETGLPWVPTSPHLPDSRTAFFYPATGIIGELDGGMIGIGYTLPFGVLATTDIDALALAKAMNALELEGVAFRPIWFKPYYGSRKGQAMQGVQLHITNPHTASLTAIQFYFLQEARRLNPAFNPFEGKQNRYAMFDKVCGSATLREHMMKQADFGSLADWWQKDAASFKEKSTKYYLY